jgi:hypothetical protein
MKWLLGFLVGLIISASSYWLFWHAQTGLQHPSTAWITDFYEVKQSIATDVAAPKLLIVAGSTGLFSFDSEVLAKALGKPVVNYSVAAGLGLRYILERAKNVLSSGDTVLLPLEYKLYQDQVSPDQTLPLHLLDNSDYFETLSIFEKVELVISTPIRPLFDHSQNVSASLQSDLYRSTSLNASGDINRSVLEGLYTQYEVNKYNFPYVNPVSINQRSHDLLVSFVIWSKANDIHVVAMPPSVIRSPSLAGQGALDVKRQLYSFWDTLGVPFIGRFDDFEFTKDMMFENPYHLNHRGRDAFMVMLLKITFINNNIHIGANGSELK